MMPQTNTTPTAFIDPSIETPVLMTDMYEYTMLETAMQDGTASRPCVFEVYARHLPNGRRYGVVAGLGRLLTALQNFRPNEQQIQFLCDRHIISPVTAQWLENYTFHGSIRAYPEGELYFPNSPVLQVESTFAEGIQLIVNAIAAQSRESRIVVRTLDRQYTE